MRHVSSPELLTLHGVRVLGFADTAPIASRFSLDRDQMTEFLEDFRALGWVDHSAFADMRGWSLTAAGRAENERWLADELSKVGCREEINAAYRDFLPLNSRLQRACTDWQVRPTDADQLAENDHCDLAWDDAVLDELTAVGRDLGPVAEHLDSCLTRLSGYDARFSAALDRVRSGDTGWINRTDVDSCHRVWFELHEDLIATLGLTRDARY